MATSLIDEYGSGNSGCTISIESPVNGFSKISGPGPGPGFAKVLSGPSITFKQSLQSKVIGISIRALDRPVVARKLLLLELNSREEDGKGGR